MIKTERWLVHWNGCVDLVDALSLLGVAMLTAYRPLLRCLASKSTLVAVACVNSIAWLQRRSGALTLSGSVAQRTLPGPAESDSAIGAAAFVINTSVEEFFSLIRRKKGRSSSSTTTDELGILARHPSHLPSCKCRNLEVVRMEKRLRRGMLASRNVFYTK